MKKGDSAVTIQSIDTLMKQGMQLPPTAQKGDRIVTSFSILNVFTADSTARADFDKEKEKSESVEIAKGLKDMDTWLAAKKINAQRTGKGTYVHIDEPGTGPAVEIGKYVNVKYTGKVLETDSTFQSSTYDIKLGTDPVIQGWLEGLQLFKQGGKGTIYIPGFLAYGQNPGPAGKPYAPLLFDVEILQVSDQPINQPAAPQPGK
jgi:FKBP-type peptidyl-prolyl cis-trans isomerase